MITQGGYTLADDLHSGMIQAIGLHDLPLHRRVYFGLRGEGHVVGQPAGRELVAPIVFDGFATPATLQAAIDAKESLVQVPLVGDVVQTINGAPRTLRQCTFLGIDYSSENFTRDAITMTWFCFAYYRWRQRVPN